MAKPPYVPLLQDLPPRLRNLPTLSGVCELADQALAPLDQDIYDTSQLLSVETTTDFSYLQGLFDPYGLIDILLGNQADIRKYYRLLKTLYALKGTTRGWRMAMDLLKLSFEQIITQNVVCCAEMTMVLTTTQPDLLQFRRVDQLDQVYLPIDTTLVGVTNAPIVSATPGPYKVGSLTANSLDYNLTLGTSRLGYPLGAKIPQVSNSIYFLFWSTLLAELSELDAVAADSMMDYVFSSDFIYDTAGATRLDWVLRLGYQDLQQLKPPIVSMWTTNYGTDGYAYADYRLSDFLRPNYGVPPSPAPAPDAQVSWDTAERAQCYHSLVLGANNLDLYPWQPLGGPRPTLHWGGGLGQGKLSRTIVLDAARDLYTTRSFAIQVAVDRPRPELVAQYGLEDLDPAALPQLYTHTSGVGDDCDLSGTPVDFDSRWSIAGGETSATVGFGVVGEAIVGQSAV